MKKTLIACYLVLCAYFSFAQDKGKVVLEIPMDLSSSYFGGDGYHGYLIQNQEKSKYALLARDKSNVYLSVIDAQFNLKKNVEYSLMWAEYTQYPNFIMGYFEGTKYNFVFGDKRMKKFAVMSIDSVTQKDTKVVLEPKIDEDNNNFLMGITVNGKNYLLFAKKAKSILDFYEIKSDFQLEKVEFDLEKDFPAGSLSKLFKEGYGLHTLNYINPSQPLNLFSTFSFNKLYTDNNKVTLQVGKEKKIISFDLTTQKHQTVTYKRPSFTTHVDGEVQYNSMIYKDKLYQVNAHKGELVLSITDLADGNIIKEHRMIGGDDKQSEPNLKNSPYYENNGREIDTESEIDNSKKFLRKVSNAAGIISVGGVSIAINEIADQKLYVMIGSVTFTPAGGGGGGGMMMATGSMGTPGGSVPTYSFVPMAGGVGGGGYEKKSFYVDTMLDLNTSEYIKTDLTFSYFRYLRHEVRWQMYNADDSHAENILKTADGYILAYFSSKSKKFIFKKY